MKHLDYLKCSEEKDQTGTFNTVLTPTIPIQNGYDTGRRNPRCEAVLFSASAAWQPFN